MNKYSIPAEKRAKLDSLSKEVYGASSRWVKYMEKGRLEPHTRKLSETRPPADENDKSTDEERTTTFNVPVNYMGAEKSVIQSRKRLTLEEVEADMNARKEAMDKFRAMLQKQKDDAEAAKAQAKLEADVARQVSGSAAL